jgi:y4mF family transcriptional regulator
MPQPISSPEAFGAVIRSRREGMGWTQQQLANKIGMSRQWVVSLERGNTSVALDRALRALFALGMELSADVHFQPPNAELEALTARFR